MAYWSFPSNQHGEIKGINDSGIATFRGTPLKSLAREICQNSLDAANSKTVRVDFSAFEIPSNDLPSVNVLKDVFERCSDFWKIQNSKITVDFFDNAVKKINEGTISMLRISDFNTKGLTGSSEFDNYNTDWMKLTKSSGSSDKKGPAGGSYGIGKFAPFACSDFSTVFYSTYDIKGRKAHQGVARLVTFKDNQEETTQGIGYYGNNKNTPILDELHLDKSFSRKSDEFGTDIYITAYRFSGSNWENEIVISILDGFLGAIWNEKLVVNVGNIEISKASLPDIMEAYKDELSKNHVLEYYQVLTSSKTKWFERDHMGKGLVRFGILLGASELSRRVAMIRQTGMKIKDGKGISGHIPFAGVLFIEGDKINEELRAIENPEHTEWQPDRSSKPFVARQLVKSINDYMISCLNELVSNGDSEQMDAVGVASFIPDIPDNENEKSKEEAITDIVVNIEKTIVVRKPSKGKKSNSNKKGKSADKGEPVPGVDDEDWVHGKKPNPGPIPRPPQPVDIIPGKPKVSKDVDSEIDVAKFLAICPDPSTGKYFIDFVPNEDGENGKLELYISGETEVYKAKIISAMKMPGGNLNISGNKLSGLLFKKGEHIKIALQLDYNHYCSMEVKAYAYKH